jgi:hypothetical protein
MPTGLGQSHRAEITLFVRDKSLILTWTPHLHRRLLRQPQPASEIELVRGVVRLDLAYWGAPFPDRPAEWQAQWEDVTAPELIRVQLVLTDKDRRQWPDLLVDSKL